MRSLQGLLRRLAPAELLQGQAEVEVHAGPLGQQPGRPRQRGRRFGRFTEEQIAFVLRQAEAGTTVTDVCRGAGVSEATF